MVKICKVCGKRHSKFPVTVKISSMIEKDVEMCKVCYQKYMKLRERYLIKAYKDLVEQNQGLKQ
jgi:hypothetical protein